MELTLLLASVFLTSSASAQIIRTASTSELIPVLYPAAPQPTPPPEYRFPIRNPAELNTIVNELGEAVQSWFSTVTRGSDYEAYLSALPPDVASVIRVATDIQDLADLSTYPTSFWSTVPASAKSYYSEVNEAQQSFIRAAVSSLGGVVVSRTRLPGGAPTNVGNPTNTPVETSNAAVSGHITRTRLGGTFLVVGAVSVGILAVVL